MNHIRIHYLFYPKDIVLMTTSNIPVLRPLSIGELLDRAIRLYRRSFLTFVGIIALVQIPLTLLSLIISLATFSDTALQLQDPSYMPSDPFEMFGSQYWTGMAANAILSIISFVLLQGVATAALTRSVADHYLGKPIHFADAYTKIGNTWLRLIGALLLAFLCILGLVVWTIIPCIGWFTGIGLLAFFSAVIVPLISPIIVLEKQTALRAIRRAWDLTRRRFWWVVGFVAVLSIFAQIVVTGPSVLITLLFNALSESIAEATSIYMTFAIQTISQSLLTLFFSLIYTPLQLTCLTLMYFDLRVRTEGFDLTLMASSAANEKVDSSQVIAQAPPPEKSGLITGKEIGYFVLLSLAVVAIWFVFGAFVGLLGLGAMGLSGGF
jgi:hypothetical protein